MVSLSVSVEEQRMCVALVYVSLCVCGGTKEQGINSDVALVYVSLCVCGGTRD